MACSAVTMAQDQGGVSSTPKPNPRALKKSTSSTQNTKKKQPSILGFFQPKSSPCTPTPPASSNPRQSQQSQTRTLTQSRKGASELPSSPAQRAAEDKKTRQSVGNGATAKKNSNYNMTPVPSSDIVGPEDGDVDAETSVTPSRKVLDSD